MGSVIWCAGISEEEGGILKQHISPVSYRSKNLKNHISLLNQENWLAFGRAFKIHKSYNLNCILCLIFVAMVTVYKETLSYRLT